MRTIDASQGFRITSTRSMASLLSQVLWITTAGFVATAVGAYISPALLGGGINMLLFLVTLGLIFAVNATARTSPSLALVLFYGFTFLMGVEVGPLIKLYLHMPGGEAVVFNAAITTAVGMAAMAMVAQVAQFNYRKVQGYAMLALFAQLLVGMLSMFFHFISPGLYSWAALAIFSVLLLVDFMRLRDGGMGLAPVQLALSIYLDALNIFIILLQLFGNNNNRRRNSGWN